VEVVALEARLNLHRIEDPLRFAFEDIHDCEFGLVDLDVAWPFFLVGLFVVVVLVVVVVVHRAGSGFV